MNESLAKSLKVWIGKKRPYVAAAVANSVLQAGGTNNQAAQAASVAGNAAKPNVPPVQVGTQTTNNLAAAGLQPKLSVAAGGAAAGALSPPGPRATNAIISTVANGATNLATPSTPPGAVGTTAANAALAAGASPTAAGAAKVAAQNIAALQKYNQMTVSNLVKRVNSVSSANMNSLEKALKNKMKATNATPSTVQKLKTALNKLSSQKSQKK